MNKETLVKKLETIRTQQGKLNKDILTLEKKRQDAQDQINQELMDRGKSDRYKELADVSLQADSMKAAIHFIDLEMEKINTELQDIERAENKEKAERLESEMMTEIQEICSLLLSMKSKMDKALFQSQEIVSLNTGIDLRMKAEKYNFLWSRHASNLLVMLKEFHTIPGMEKLPEELKIFGKMP